LNNPVALAPASLLGTGKVRPHSYVVTFSPA
jgi:hypothetical protein